MVCVRFIIVINKSNKLTNKMPFIELMDDACEFWTEYRYAFIAVCMTVIVCVFILCCDSVECAILFAHALVIIYCVLWIMVIHTFEKTLLKKV
jgi:hypothetical protein